MLEKKDDKFCKKFKCNNTVLMYYNIIVNENYHTMAHFS